MNYGKDPIPQDRYPVSMWRVCLPSDIDREVYIKSCYLTGTISLVDEFGERQDRVKIGRLALQSVNFPPNSDSVGSEVICASMPYSGRLYVLDVFASSDDFIDQDEQQYRLVRSINGGYAEVRVDGNGRILLTVDSEGDAEIVIASSNKDRKGKLTINVNGEVNILNDGKTTIKSTEQVLVDSPKILLNDSEEPIILGKKLVDLLSEWLDQLGKESAGPYPLLGNQFYIQLKEKLEALKSTLSFVK